MQQLFHPFENLRETVESLALANIHHNGRTLNFDGFLHQSGKIRQQFQRQVVNGMEAQIFKGSERRSFARAGDSSDYDQFLRGLLAALAGLVASLALVAVGDGLEGVMGTSYTEWQPLRSARRPYRQPKMSFHPCVCHEDRRRNGTSSRLDVA